MRRRKTYGRRYKGTAIAEFGPALFIILIVIFFPMLDLLFLGVAYCAGWYENHLVIHDVVCHDPTDPTAINTAVANAQSAWQSSGLCQGLGGPSKCNVSNSVLFIQVDNSTDTTVGAPAFPAPNPIFVNPNWIWTGYAYVKSTITVQPWLPVNLGISCPGINQPVTYVFADQRPQEEKAIDLRKRH